MEIAKNAEASPKFDTIKSLVQEILELKSRGLREASGEEKAFGKSRRALKSGKKHEKETRDSSGDNLSAFDKHQAANKARKVEKKLNRGKLHSLKNIPAGHHLDKKAHKVIHSSGKPGNTKFANATTFRDTRSDAHLHTDADCNQGLRGRTSPELYAKHADASELKKHPCKKSYPIFATPGDRARIAGSARMAAEYKNPEVISRIKAAGEKIGMHIHGNLWNERPECKEYNRSGKLPSGWSKKDCEPHGEGGADEWLRKFKVHKSREGKLKHAPTMRHPMHYGKGKLPKSHHADHLYAKHGGHWGEKAVQFGRNLAGHDKTGRPGHHVSGAKWSRSKLKSTGIRHGHEVGHAASGSEPKGPGTQVKKNFKYSQPKYVSKGEHRTALRSKKNG